ncbi:MAG: GTPase [Nanoarchaeota archaeon]
MPTNPGYEYVNALKKYHEAQTDEDRLKALQLMQQTAPKHKSSEKLLADIKNKISKLIAKLERKKEQKKSSGGFTLSVKKEGAAQVVIVGTTNSGKSTLLNKLTNANAEIADYPFTTKKPQVGIIDYHGIKIQIVEIPAVVKNFAKTQLGPTFLSIIRNADLIILMFKTPEEKRLLDLELEGADKPILIYNSQENLTDEIWKRLNLIKIYTKQPGKERDFPPIAFKKGSTVRDVAEMVHKDFVKKFRYARIFGKSVKFNGAQVGLDHRLEDDDVVELHLS